MKEYCIASLLDRPLTIEEIKERSNDYGRLSVILPVYLSDLIGRSTEDVLQLFSYMSVGNALMTDIQYELSGVKNGMLQIMVDGDVSALLDKEEFLERDYY